MNRRPDWNVCVVQMNVRIGEPERNREEVIQRVEEAVMKVPKPDIIVLPEMWNTGYAWNRIHELAEPDGKTAQQLLRELAALHHIHIIGGSVAIKENGKLYNVCYVVNNQGETVLTYKKAHLFQLMNEHLHLTAGSEAGIFELDGVRCGVIICYDLRFPEWVRMYALEGVEVLFVPAQWPIQRLVHWQTLLRARSIENQIAVVACNRMGTSIDAEGAVTTFCGHSAIIDPWGEVVAEAELGESLICGRLDLTLIPDVRARIPIFQDRRVNVYRM
ncbi:carbon-nitrogen family hydrolase [Paenibacillus marinisediminis]